MFECAEVLKVLNEYCGISKDCDFASWDIGPILGKAAEKLDAKIASGATKAVLVLDNMAIKIPLNLNDDASDVFTNANCSNGWDYCEAELNILKNAEVCGVGMCFAYQELIGDIHGYPVYAQEKCVIWGNVHEYEDYSEEKRSSTEKYVRNMGHYCFNECWLSDFLDYYGSEMLEKFLDFIQGQDITDLHGGNLGYVGNRPVIVDYGGYHEESYYDSYYDSWEEEEEE